ncbi:endonuclease/exonuclease/phosphatase family protein [Pseudanabaena sp. BC1403]|uniref:endonuclease/exonuclease/phosphatase family protein n=1 Tax=Pseudanabaena sp. BC1403 TaxID=2043171 RepID=UPI000CD8C8C8|nr:endonuclease/exonuclease/phosphatase family protein [Pseudanabaena sp. BC1403]
MPRSHFKCLKYLPFFWLFAIAIAGCSNPFTTAKAPDQIRLGTFNLENFDGLNTEKLEAVSQIIERNFDAIGLQEVSPIAADKLKEKLNKYKQWDFILGETGGKQRIAMFYRKDAISAQKVTEWRQVNITRTLRSPLVTYLKAGKNFDFTLVVVHQKGGGGKDADRLRQNQSVLLRKEVDNYQKDTQSDPDLILVGDFNSPTWADQNRGLRDAPLTFLTKAIETDAKENCLKKRGQPKTIDGRPRYSNRGIGCVIDHIAISKAPKGAEEEYIPQSIQILDPQKDLGFDSDRTYFAKVSDHLPVRAIFRAK